MMASDTISINKELHSTTSSALPGSRRNKTLTASASFLIKEEPLDASFSPGTHGVEEINTETTMAGSGSICVKTEPYDMSCSALPGGHHENDEEVITADSRETLTASASISIKEEPLDASFSPGTHRMEEITTVPGSSRQGFPTNPAAQNSGENTACKWTDGETTLLMDLYDRYSTQLGPYRKFKNKKTMFDAICKELNKILNTSKTSEQCDTRIRTVMKRKKKAVDNNRTSETTTEAVPYESTNGSRARMAELKAFFEKMDDMNQLRENREQTREENRERRHKELVRLHQINGNLLRRLLGEEEVPLE